MTTDKRKPTKNMPNSKTNKKMEAQAKINFVVGGGVCRRLLSQRKPKAHNLDFYEKAALKTVPNGTTLHVVFIKAPYM